MISKKLANNVNSAEFLELAKYFGIAIDSKSSSAQHKYADLERFFLAATYNLTSSRLAEGFLCWLERYGHLLSPSKVRRLIKSEVQYDSAVLGGLYNFLIDKKINARQWLIIKPFVHKNSKPKPLVLGPLPSNPNPLFLKYNVIAHNYKLDESKFLRPISYTYKNCVVLKNRALFGSTVHADVASYLNWNPTATPYEIAKNTGNHKARVFEIFQDIRVAL